MKVPGLGVVEVEEESGEGVGVRYRVTEGRVEMDFFEKVRELRCDDDDDGDSGLDEVEMDGDVEEVGDALEKLLLAGRALEDGVKVQAVQMSEEERMWLDRSLPLIEDLLLATSHTHLPELILPSKPSPPNLTTLQPQPTLTSRSGPNVIPCSNKANTTDGASDFSDVEPCSLLTVDDDAEDVWEDEDDERIFVTVERYLELLRVEEVARGRGLDL
ncbi:hypothetical protein BC829DRAFT_283419 [Chytridium lagenaria]|nr:hypothetical protein BC829DRAFT_283419 [Chytridium lagenaria]